MGIIDMALNSERFADWFIMSIIGIITWWFGYITINYQTTIKVPRRLAKVIVARPNKQGEVDLNGFSFQIIGVLTLFLSSVAWVAPTHELAVWIFFCGFLAFFALAGILMAYYRHHK